MACLILFERRQKARSILAIHHVDDKDDIRRAQIPINLAPLIFRQSRAEVVRRHPQVERILTVNLTLSLSERR
jgi:hypothetical protein